MDKWTTTTRRLSGTPFSDWLIFVYLYYDWLLMDGTPQPGRRVKVSIDQLALMHRVLVCGDEPDDQDIEFLKKISNHGFQICLIQAPKIHKHLGKANVPHVQLQTAEAVSQMFTQDVALVVAFVASTSMTPWSSACHSFVRSAAMQFEKTAIVLSATDYAMILESVTQTADLSLTSRQRKMLAEKAFRFLSDMDAKMANDLASATGRSSA